jgi:ribonuclease Z
MDELYILGTGNAVVTKCYNTCFALRNQEEFFLVDCGGGNTILQQLEKMEIPLSKIHHIFITHEHCDHILGIVWMVRMIATQMKANQYEGNLTIYSHSELIPVMESLCQLTIMKKFTKFIGERIFFVAVSDGETKEILDTSFTFFDIGSTKAKQYGFKMTARDGKTIGFCGDEPCHDGCIPYVKDCDWLFHEAFCLYEDRETFKPYEKHHSTVKDACELATSLHSQNLILWHTEDKTGIETRKERYLKEGKEYFKGNLYIPNDLEKIKL